MAHGGPYDKRHGERERESPQRQKGASLSFSYSRDEQLRRGSAPCAIHWAPAATAETENNRARRR